MPIRQIDTMLPSLATMLHRRFRPFLSPRAGGRGCLNTFCQIEVRGGEGEREGQEEMTGKHWLMEWRASAPAPRTHAPLMEEAGRGQRWVLWAGPPPRPLGGGFALDLPINERHSAIAAPGSQRRPAGGELPRTGLCPGPGSCRQTPPLLGCPGGRGGRREGRRARRHSSLGDTVSPTTAGGTPGVQLDSRGEPVSFGAETESLQDGGSQRDTPVPGRGAGSPGPRQETPRGKEAERDTGGASGWSGVEGPCHRADARDRVDGQGRGDALGLAGGSVG